MTDNNTYFLHPSNLFVSNTPYQITTVLGSCVAVCLFDPVNKIGGMNHYMLPLWNGEGLASPKYGSIAIEKLVNKMTEKGAVYKNMIAKVFGGAELFGTKINYFNIGQRNHELAIQTLNDFKIPIIAKSVGGDLGRKIKYDTSTGKILHKFVQK